MAPKEPAKKGALTLEKLAMYDDILTDALVDKVQTASTIELAPFLERELTGNCRYTTGQPSERIAAVASRGREA